MIPFSFQNDFQNRLDHLEKAGRYRTFRVLDSGSGPIVDLDGRPRLLFASNDYLGLAGHPRMIRDTAAAVEKFGTGMGASRLVAGNHRLHEEVERGLAELKKTAGALLFSSGYLTHIGVVPTLVGPGDLIFSDSLNHASLVDACRLSRAEVVVYPHGDTDFMATRLGRKPPPGGSRILIVTDGVFSMDGDLAPLPEILALAGQYEALVLVDDAHATGVLGPYGEGSTAHWGIDPESLLTMGTFSKALGALGGFVAGPEILMAYLRNQARTLFYSTALPPAVCASVLRALHLLREEPGLLAGLRRNCAYFSNGLRALGLPLPPAGIPIFPIIVGTEAKALHLSRALWDRDICIPAIRPPTVPLNQCRLRISLSAGHTEEQMDTLLAALRELL
ncbi:MAG: 8-amino-7-oxononanoate synthase [Desulfobacterota bacterium]|nr:8-amino-7-oxononanoate synthase [Thermodesulfobacteriota bacterium]